MHMARHDPDHAAMAIDAVDQGLGAVHRQGIHMRDTRGKSRMMDRDQRRAAIAGGEHGVEPGKAARAAPILALAARS